MKNIIAIGPMSSEVIEATFRYSHTFHRPFMLIASKNQIDYNGGYVNGWTTKDYMSFIKEQRSKYLDSDVLICRDHCGPGFNGSESLTDVFKTIEEDTRQNFDLIHIDFCYYKAVRELKLSKTLEAITYAYKRKPNIRLEIGTDEIRELPNISRSKRDVEYFLEHCTPEYYVINTGSHVLEGNQVGTFNSDVTYQAKLMLAEYGISLKEHNADFLTPEQIQQRKGLVDAMNIAPEFGLRQTERVLHLANMYGIDTKAFLQAAYKSKKWKKWLHLATPDDVGICSVLAGHYIFNSPEYKRIIKHLNDHLDVKEDLISTAMEVIDRYATNY